MDNRLKYKSIGVWITLSQLTEITIILLLQLLKMKD